MSDLISRQTAMDAIQKRADEIGSPYSAFWEGLIEGLIIVKDIIKNLPSAEPEIIPIEEVSNLLGCATMQSVFYWFEFLKTLDSLGLAIVRKKTR